MTRRGIAVGACGREDGLPDVPLLGGAAVGAEDVFVGEFAAGGGDDGAVRLAVGGDGDLAEVALADEGVGVVVEVDVLVGVEVDGVGAGGLGAVVEVGIEDLRGERFPSAGGTAEGGARPALADAAILLLDGGDQLVVDGGAVGADVGGVDDVGVVVVGVGVLDVDQDHARQAAVGPVLKEAGSRAAAAAAGRLDRVAVGGEGAGPMPAVEVILIDDEGIFGVGVFVEAVGQQDPGAEVDVAAPEAR